MKIKGNIKIAKSYNTTSSAAHYPVGIYFYINFVSLS
jgi:hypothetical protein